MPLEDFIQFAQTIPEPILLVTSEGSIVAGNRLARALLGEARALADVSVDTNWAEVLRMMARSRDPISAGAVFRTAAGEEFPFRCDGGLLRPRTATEPALLSMRLRPRETSGPRFVELNSKLDALNREIKTRRRAEALIRAQAETLELTAVGAPLRDILEKLVLTIENDALRPLSGSILLFDPGTRRLRHGAAPHLPLEYSRAIDGVEIGPAVGSCGTAAHRVEQVIVEDIAVDPLWKDFRELALDHDLRSCWSTPILSSSGAVLGTFAIYRDEPGTPQDRELETVEMLTRIASLAIERDALETQRLDLHQRERLARAAAETANRIKDEFLATVSHELRTPLTAIVGWASLLRDLPHDEATREGIAVIESSARAQSQIIEDLLDFSRLTADKLRVEKRRIDLAATVQEAVETVRPAADRSGVRLSLHAGALGGVIAGDADRIRQVVWNLLTNAIKFAPGGNVVVTLEDSGDAAAVVVTDDGEGIDPGFLPHVFDRFSQADSSPRRNHGGLGLGLSIVRRLVEMHDGSVDVASAGKGKGATFTVRLPYDRSAERLAASRPSLPTADRTLAGTRLLLVEDDAPSRNVLCRMLESAGIIVRATASAADAILEYRRELPDVLLSDVAMPEMDGYQLIQELRGEGGPRVPAVALTSYARAVDRDEALANGFDAYIAKPVAIDQLLATLREALRTRVIAGDQAAG